jgi:hypothetical protein
VEKEDIGRCEDIANHALEIIRLELVELGFDAIMKQINVGLEAFFKLRRILLFIVRRMLVGRRLNGRLQEESREPREHWFYGRIAI